MRPFGGRTKKERRKVSKRQKSWSLYRHSVVVDRESIPSKDAFAEEQDTFEEKAVDGCIDGVTRRRIENQCTDDQTFAWGFTSYEQAERLAGEAVAIAWSAIPRDASSIFSSFELLSQVKPRRCTTQVPCPSSVELEKGASDLDRPRRGEVFSAVHHPHYWCNVLDECCRGCYPVGPPLPGQAR